MELAAADHRPWPLPHRPWSVRMTWHDLLFAHWPIPTASLRSRIPGSVTIDTFDGVAWIGVIPFHMSGVCRRGLPDLGIASRFAELNVRTYVRLDDKAGVWFFSLDAASWLAALVARWWYHLAYRHARMTWHTEDGWIHYQSTYRGTYRGSRPETFAGRYRPHGPVFRSNEGDLEHWFTERYCLYATDRRGAVLRADIHHAPWPLQRAELHVEENTMLDDFGVDTNSHPPHLLFAKRLDTVAWSTRRVGAD
jgi:uncharacterized protein YqjF (DUF2071 family)